MQETERRRELVALFEGHGALAEPTLLAELAAAPDGPVRVMEVLRGLSEVPFHFDRALWAQLEQRRREAVVTVTVPAPAPTVTAESAHARKEAMRRAAAAVYDSGRKARMAGEDGAAEGEPDALDEHPEGDGALDEEAPLADAQADARGFKVVPRGERRPLAAEHASRLEVVSDMTGNSTCEGTTQDFVTYFQDRYRQLAKMLRQRRELRNATPVERVKPGQQEVQVIGMVVELATTKNGHKRIQVEDETGAITCLVKADERQLMAMADTLV